MSQPADLSDTPALLIYAIQARVGLLNEVILTEGGAVRVNEAAWSAISRRVAQRQGRRTERAIMGPIDGMRPTYTDCMIIGSGTQDWRK